MCCEQVELGRKEHRWVAEGRKASREEADDYWWVGGKEWISRISSD